MINLYTYLFVVYLWKLSVQILNMYKKCVNNILQPDYEKCLLIKRLFNTVSIRNFSYNTTHVWFQEYLKVQFTWKKSTYLQTKI